MTSGLLYQLTDEVDKLNLCNAHKVRKDFIVWLITNFYLCDFIDGIEEYQTGWLLMHQRFATEYLLKARKLGEFK